MRWIIAVLTCVSWMIAPQVHGASRPLQTVFPQLAGKNDVRWWDFKWQWNEFARGGGAPVRLYYYDEEANIAEFAKPLIAEAYAEYVTAFNYTPTSPIPFLLYNSHFEFESTTAFFVSEQVLGVTSTENLRMAIPFWGERRRFIHVMRHEMAHQFNIQKVRDLSKNGRCNPIEFMPLWFIEGLAERFSLNGMTPEVRMALVDARMDKEGREENKLPSFFLDEPMDFERIYLLGHAQVRYLEESFGPNFVTRVLEASKTLCSSGPVFWSSAGGQTFISLLTHVSGASQRSIEDGWRAWVDKQVAPARKARQPFTALNVLPDLGPGDIDTFALSPDGHLVFYRMLDPDTGVARLYLRDVRDPDSRIVVAADQQIGLESLHPIDRSVTALLNDRLVYMARSGSADRIFARRIKRREVDGRVRLSLGKKVVHELDDVDGEIVETGYPALNPQDGSLAFVGLSRSSGLLDIYRMDDPLKKNSPVAQLTDDVYAEQGLAFVNGDLIATSDATPDGRPAIVALAGGRRRWLALVDRDGEMGVPRSDGSGGVVFAAGVTDVPQTYRIHAGNLQRLTDVPTGFSQPAVAVDGTLLGLTRVDGKRRLVSLPRDKWLAEPVSAVVSRPETLEPYVAARGNLEPSYPYRPFDYRNFGLAGAGGAIGTGSFALGGIAFTDLFQSRIVGLNLQVLGDLDNSLIDLFYVDRSSRLAKGADIFLRTGLQLEPRFRDRRHAFLLRRYGVSFLGEYPLNRYIRLSASLSPQGLKAYSFSDRGGAFAREHEGNFGAGELGTGISLDTTRLSLYGPVSGLSSSIFARGTLVSGGQSPFAQIESDVRGFYPLIHGYERLVLSGRLAGGTSFGGRFREQFYVPAAYNLRALREGSFDLLGEHYVLSQIELMFPLGPPISRGIYFQGIGAFDAGSIFFPPSEAQSRRAAAGVAGVNFGLSILQLRLHAAFPFGPGAAKTTLWHFSIATPFQ